MPINNAIIQGAAPGLSRLAQAFGQRNAAYQQGYDATLDGRAKFDQAMSAAQANRARADQDNAETQVFQNRPQLIDEGIAASTGTTLPLIRAVQEHIRTGIRPMKAPMGPADEAGNEAMAFPVVDDATQSRITQALVRALPLRTNLKDANLKEAAEATGLFNQQDQDAAVLNGTLSPMTLATARYAAKGNAPYHFDSSGLVGNNLTGDLNESGGRAGAVTSKELELGNQAKAGAVAHYAQAAHANAQAKNAAAAGAGGGKPPNGYEWGPADEDGARTLVAISGGPADKQMKLKDIPPTVNAKIIEGAQGLDNIDKAIEAVQKNPGAFGMANAVPFVERMRQGDTNGVDARAQVANIGSLKLHDRSGAAVSASEFPRLAPFIPSSSDDSKAIVTKLKKMKEIAEGELGLFTDTYNEDSGYKPNAVLTRRAVRASAPAAKPAASGFKYLGKE